jgi:precorrin-3B synthase
MLHRLFVRIDKAGIITAFALVRSAAIDSVRRDVISDRRLNNHLPVDQQTVVVRPSACPGLLRIAPALDGGICRIKLPCGRLTTAQALAIADLAERCASGIIEITNRANLQLRGVTAEHADSLIEGLLAAGLGPSTSGGDDVRNLLVSPTLGIDVETTPNIEPLASQILESLQNQTRFHQLSPKFAILLDGGERTAMLEHPHDLWLSIMPGSDSLMAFGLAGCPPLASSLSTTLAAVPEQDVLALVEAVLQLFLDLARPEQTRMRHLLDELSAAKFLQLLRQRVSFPLFTDDSVFAWRRVSPMHYTYIGVHAQRQADLPQTDLYYVGAAPVLGRIDVVQLRGLAELAREYGDGVVRATPWQNVLLANVTRAGANLVAAEMQNLGLSCDPNAVLTRTIACTGSSGCAKGLADTKSDALALATFLNAALTDRLERNSQAGFISDLIPAVHLSGCMRSCAAAHIAPFTLLAKASGIYDVFQRDASCAGFGRLLASKITIETASELLVELSLNLSLSVEHPA